VRRLAVALSALALVAAGCASSHGVHGTQPPPPLPSTAAHDTTSTAYRAAQSHPREDSVYPDVGHPSVDALHYDLHVLRNAPLQAPDVANAISPLLPRATRRGDRVLVLGPPVGTTEALAAARVTTLLPLGDPTRRAPDGSADRALTRAVRDLRIGDRLVVPAPWLAPGRILPGDALAARTALERVGERFALTPVGGNGAFTVVRLDVQ